MYNQSAWISESVADIIAEPNCCIRAQKKRYDAVVDGANRNDLTTAAHLARAGKSALVQKRRHLVGGSAVGEVIDLGDVSEFEVALAENLSVTSRIQSRNDRRFGFEEDAPVPIGWNAEDCNVLSD